MSSRRWILVSLVLAAAASGGLLVIPSYSGVSVVATSHGDQAAETFSATLVEVNGRRVLGLLGFPIVVALVALIPWPRPMRSAVVTIGAVLFCGFAVLGAFSIGLFYLPAGIAMCFALGESLHARERRR